MTGRWHDPNAAERHRWIVRSILGDRPTPDDHPDTSCPHCAAPPGASCKRPAKGGPVDCPPHPSRIGAAGQAAGRSPAA
jgi:hypothetical protein